MKKKPLIIEVEAVKIIGKIKGTKKKIELLMDAETYYKWRGKIAEDGR